MDNFDGFVLRSTGTVMGDLGIKWGRKNLLNLDYADDLKPPRSKCEQND